MQENSKTAIWTKRLLAHGRSDLPIRAWCALEGVSEATFHYWRKRLAEAPTAPTEFIALPRGTPSQSRLPRMELTTPEGYVISLSSPEQVVWLSGVLAAIR